MVIPVFIGGAMAKGAVFGVLSLRERECLSLVAQGFRVAHIAHRLAIAGVTVELHLRQARIKLNARTLPHAVARALETGQIGSQAGVVANVADEEAA